MAGADASAASVPFLPRRRRTWRWPAPDLVREEERHFGATASLAADGGGGGPSAGEHGNGTAGLHGGEEDVELGWICGRRRWSSFAGASHSSLPSAAIPFPLLFSGVLSLSVSVGMAWETTSSAGPMPRWPLQGAPGFLRIQRNLESTAKSRER
jgi:hypothetical protein